MERVLAEAAERGIVADAVIAGSLAQSRAIWRLRETASEAQKVGRRQHQARHLGAGGAHPGVHRRGGAGRRAHVPGARPVPFGHFGDGNVHYNVTQPPGHGQAAFLALWKPMSEAVHDIVPASAARSRPSTASGS